jgi:hypothetical protein
MHVVVRLSATASIRLHLTAEGRARVSPAALRLRPGRPRSVRLTVATPGVGRVIARDPTGRIAASIPWSVAAPARAPVSLGPLRLTGRPTADGVRFALGAFDRGDPLGSGSAVQLAERLVLQLIRADGTVQETLTAPGGALELMPAEYAYTIPRADLDRLPPGRYAFRATAYGTGRGAPPATARSPAFRR